MHDCIVGVPLAPPPEGPVLQGAALAPVVQAGSLVMRLVSSLDGHKNIREGRSPTVMVMIPSF